MTFLLWPEQRNARNRIDEIIWSVTVALAVLHRMKGKQSDEWETYFVSRRGHTRFVDDDTVRKFFFFENCNKSNHPLLSVFRHARTHSHEGDIWNRYDGVDARSHCLDTYWRFQSIKNENTVELGASFCFLRLSRLQIQFSLAVKLITIGQSNVDAVCKNKRTRLNYCPAHISRRIQQTSRRSLLLQGRIPDLWQRYSAFREAKGKGTVEEQGRGYWLYLELIELWSYSPWTNALLLVLFLLPF